MNIKNFYNKHQDIIELARGYLGIIVLTVIIMYGAFEVKHYLSGVFNSQVEILLSRRIR